MTYQFDLAPENKPGYDINQVNAFIALARQQFSDQNRQLLSSNQVRQVEFDLVHGGYDIKSVDGAIERLEDAFVAREISRERQIIGNTQIDLRFINLKNLLEGRLCRPKNKKFSRAAWPLRGYNRKQVDELCVSLSAGLNGGANFEVKQARNAIFKASRGGYVEGQVDAFIDRAVEYLQLQNHR